MRALLGRHPRLTFVVAYCVGCGLFAAALLQAVRGQWGWLLLLFGLAGGFLAGFKTAADASEADESEAVDRGRATMSGVVRGRVTRAISRPPAGCAALRFDYRTRRVLSLNDAAERRDGEPGGYRIRRVTASTPPSVPKGQWAPRAFTAATAVNHKSWTSSDMQR